MGRWIGIDYGTRRIGLAATDPQSRLATPIGTLPASGQPSLDADHILAWAAQNHATGIVLGLPLNMDGSDSPQTRLVRDLAALLQQRGNLPVHLWDERLTTMQADTHLAGTRQTTRRKWRDALAAQIILQSFLDARRQPPTDRPASG